MRQTTVWCMSSAGGLSQAGHLSGDCFISWGEGFLTPFWEVPWKSLWGASGGAPSVDDG